MRRAALVPGVLALLPEYAGLVDPVSDLRATCVAAVRWLGGSRAIYVHGSVQGVRIAQHLAGVADVEVQDVVDDDTPVLVVGNGSAATSEKAPGHLHPEAASFDVALRRALLAPDPRALAALDLARAEEVWADVDALAWLGRSVLSTNHRAELDFDAAPFGVQYWVVRWTSARQA